MPTLKAGIVPVTAFQQNCTLIWDEDSMKGAVVDPGGNIEQLSGVIAQAGFTVERILLTHGHIDHAGGAAELAEKLGVKIIGPHQADRFLLDGMEEQAREYGIPDVRNCTPDQWLEDGETVDIGPFAFDVLHCPGHSPGHVVFINAENRIAQLGDVLFKGSIGRTDFPYGDHEALINAIKTKILPLGDDMAFICGHGPPSTIGEERAGNPFIK